MNRLAILALLLTIPACADHVAGNEFGGTTEGATTASRSTDLFQSADAHCAKYGKKARVTQSGGRSYYAVSTLSFECVQ